MIDLCPHCGDALGDVYCLPGLHNPGRDIAYCSSTCRGAAYVLAFPDATPEEVFIELCAERWDSGPRPLGPSRPW
jgi:hypothetical protein